MRLLWLGFATLVAGTWLGVGDANAQGRCATMRCASGTRCVESAAGAGCQRITTQPATQPATQAATPSATPPQTPRPTCASVRCAGGSRCEEGSAGPRCAPVGATTPAAGSGLSHVGEHVLRSLKRTDATRVGRSWGLSRTNSVDAGWLVYTPRLFGRRYSDLAQAATCTGGADCNRDFGLKRCRTNAECGASGRCAPYRPTITAPGMRAENLCVGHSDYWVETLYAMMVGARRFVDITSLTMPDGRYYTAIRNAISYLSHRANPPIVRALFGSFPVQGRVKAGDTVREWTAGVAKGSRIRVYVGGYRSSNIPPSWNHSKIIAADGNHVMSGGHNMWAKQYLGINPVNDLSMRFYGGAAAESHRFVNAQWQWTCSNYGILSRVTGQARIGSFAGGKYNDSCPPMFDEAKHGLPVASPGSAAVFSLGRLARIDKKQASNTADRAILAALAAARQSILIAQQDIGPVSVPYLSLPLGKWPAPLFDEIGRALVRGVDVTLIVSNLNAKAGGLPITEATYSNGWGRGDVLRNLRKHMAKNPREFPKGAALDALICRKLTVAYWRYSSEKTYPKGEPIPNHSKTFLIDGRAFYIGSQNLYEAPLTEHGFLVDDARITADFYARYWAPLLKASKPTAGSGPDVPRAECRLDHAPTSKP